MQQPVHGDVKCVARRACHDLRSGRRGNTAAECGAGRGLFDIDRAVECVLDRAIASAATQIAFQRRSEIGALRLIERRAGHDHAGGAEAALESLCVEERLLHRMDAALGRETFDGGDGMAFGAKGRDDAAMHRLAIKQYGAGTAVAGIAAFLDAEMAEFAQEGAQALAGLRLLQKAVAVDLETHGLMPCNSLRISSASRSVICLRQAGLP